MRWIPVTERLPNESGSYLVTVPMDNGDSYVDALDYHKGKFYEYDSEWGDIEYDDVLAWMPLPEPYKADRKTENSSEKPNNCEHITEDGVTCAKYPACDDCLDNPLNKVKGSERLVKGSEQTDCQTCKWGEWYRQGYDITMMDDECGGCCSWNSKWTPKTEPTISKMEQVDEPQTDCARK